MRSTQFGDEFLQGLPLVLAGPILQHTEPESVTVWVALKQACRVALSVCDTTQNGAELGQVLLTGERATVAIGQHLHIVAVTARSPIGQHLVSDRLYAYDLHFTEQPHQTEQTLEQGLRSARFPEVSISYFDHQKPTFALPPSQVQNLRMVHGSCRKPHGDGFDALPILDCLIEAAARQPQHRPHQLFLTGDQIYSDDVADPLLWSATNLGDLLLGWDEPLPVGRREPSDVAYYTPSQFPPGERAEVATKQAGFTAGLRNKQEKVNSHLLSLGEYYASYLLAWSPVCWQTSFPKGEQVTRDRTARKAWDREVRDIRQFIHTLWKVRRALANVPAYTIFDDHDVSDDWNLNQAWCLRVYGRPLGRRAVQNALLSYALFQAWGNTPQQFEPGRVGARLLAASEAWSASRGTDPAVCGAIAQYLGMPPIAPHTGLPEFVETDGILVLDRHPEALTWHYILRSHCHEVIVLDTRTWRGYPAAEKAIAPPMLLCPQAFERQITQPLQRSGDSIATFVIAPTNLFGLQVIDLIHHWQLRRNKVFSTDVGDSWNIHDGALATFLTTLFKQRQQVVVLSGDIHYGAVVRLSHTDAFFHPGTGSVLVQLTCSAFKNEETSTRMIHTRLKEWLLPEKVRHWVGWSHPPMMAERSPNHPDRNSSQSQQTVLPPTKPDWNCALEWIRRNPARTAEFGKTIPWLLSSTERQQRAKWNWLKPLKFWQSRWLQDGHEVVGLNNLGVVQLKAERDRPSSVIQDLYWFSSWRSTQIVYSRYESQLVPNQSLLQKISQS